MSMADAEKRVAANLDKPDVYAMTLSQWLWVNVIIIPVAFIYYWIRFAEDGFGFFFLSILGVSIVGWVLAPRVVLAPEGLKVTVCMLPWFGQTPWHRMRRVGMIPSGRWIWNERTDGTTAWVWLTLADADAKEVLTKIGVRYQRHLNQFCHQCEYDLQGNTSARCPECGTEVRHVEPALQIKFDPPSDW